MTLEKLSQAVAQMTIDVNSIWNTLEEKGATAPETPNLTGVADAIANLPPALDLSVGQYGRILYTNTLEDGSLEIIPVKLESETDFTGLCNETDSNTAELTVNGHTFQKQQLIEFTSAAMPNEIPGYFLYRCCYLSLGTVSIPSNVTTIGAYFMANCSSWNKKIDYSNATGLTSIGDYFCAWQYVFNQDVDLSNAPLTAIPNRFMQSNAAFTSNLTLPDTITSIGDYFMAWSMGVSTCGNITIPNSVVSIGNYFLLKCYQFNAVLTIGSGVQTIGSYFLFYNVILNTQVIFNCTVTSIGDLFMNRTYSYDKTVEIAGNHATLGQGFMNNTSMNSVNADASENLSVILSGTWSSIATRFLSFGAWCSPNIVINGENLTIGSYFHSKNCNTSSASITITGTTSGTLGDYFIAHCPTWDGELSLASGITSIGDCFMYNLPSYTGQLTLPTTVTTIGNYFCYKHLANSNLPLGLDNVTTVGNYFGYGSWVSRWATKTLSMPKCTTIGNGFCMNSGLNVLPSLPNITTIGTYFCGGSRLIDISAWNDYSKLSSLGEHCFRSCLSILPLSLGSLIIPSTLANVPNGFMYGCYNFSGVVYVSNSTMFATSNYTFTAWNWSNAPLYQTGITFTGQGGSSAQMTIGNLTGTKSNYRKTSYVSS